MSRTRRILVVEDEPAVRSMIVRHLQRSGHDVREAGNAEDALLLAFRETTPFDLVLTDVHLPGLSGVDLARILMSHSPLRPVLVITGDADETLARNAFSYGVTGYLLKPFELFELDGAVNQSLGRLELLEATQLLARADAERHGENAARGGAIPPSWLALADERSGADRGHGFRVARMCGIVVADLQGMVDAKEQEALDLAARSHEVGRLLGPSQTPVELATRTAEFLESLNLNAATVRIVRHEFESWNGTGGPDGLVGAAIPIGSLVLRAADTLDHRAGELIRAGEMPEAAISAALEEVIAGGGSGTPPVIAESLKEIGPRIEALWLLARSARA